MDRRVAEQMDAEMVSYIVRKEGFGMDGWRCGWIDEWMEG